MSASTRAHRRVATCSRPGYRHRGHARPFRVPHFRFYRIEFAGLIRRYDALFGRERVIVLRF